MKRFAIAGAAIASLLVTGLASAAPAATTVVVTPADLADCGPAPAPNTCADAHQNPVWFFYNDENDTIDNSLGSFVQGPATPPLGQDSVQISVSGTQRRNLATYQFGGTPLADITTLKYSTYNPSAGNGGSANRSGYLQFNVDFDGSDTWQRRLVFVPAQQGGTIAQNTWKEWDAINGGNAKWGYSGPVWPGSATSGSTTKTWNQIISEYPGVRIRVTDSFLGIRVGEPYTNGYTENIDAFKFGTAAGTTVFDFEDNSAPTTKDQCKNGGWMTFHPTFGSFNNQGDCVSYVATHGRNS